MQHFYLRALSTHIVRHKVYLCKHKPPARFDVRGPCFIGFHERIAQQAGPTIDEIAQERLEAFKLKVQKQERLERLWTTHGSSARSKCSVWAPIVTLGNIVQRNKVGRWLGGRFVDGPFFRTFCGPLVRSEFPADYFFVGPPGDVSDREYRSSAWRFFFLYPGILLTVG